MAFTNVWDQTFPSDTQLASQGGADLRQLRVDTQQRMAAISGLDAAKPNFAGDAQPASWNGVLFFATDTGKIYQFNNPSWTDVTTSFVLPIKATRISGADFTTASASLVNVLTLGNLSPTTGYSFDIHLEISSSAPSVSIGFGFSGPAAPTNFLFVVEPGYNSVGNLANSNGSTIVAGLLGTLFSYTIFSSNQFYANRVWGSIENGANSGNLIFQMAISGGNTLTVKRGSFGILTT
jgi:hypothetical protein